jgi:hypothetical protein
MIRFLHLRKVTFQEINPKFSETLVIPLQMLNKLKRTLQDHHNSVVP